MKLNILIVLNYNCSSIIFNELDLCWFNTDLVFNLNI